MRKLAAFIGLTVVLLISGCAKQFVRVEPSTVTFGPVMFTTTEPWNKVDISEDQSLWTIDGITLNSFELLGSVGKGERLFGNALTIQGPTFDPTMSLPEQAEFVIASVRANDLPQVEISSLDPIRVGALDGFRLAFNGETRAGVDSRGMAIGFVHDGTLHVMLYQAASVYYFDKMKPEVDRMFDSLRPLGAEA